MSTPNSLTILSPHFLLGNHMFILSLWVCFVNKFICIVSFWSPQKAVSYHFSFFVWLTAFSMTISRSSHVAVNGAISFFLWLSNIPPRLLYPFICRWTFRLLPYLSDCKQCCCERWAACVYFPLWFIVVIVAFIFFRSFNYILDYLSDRLTPYLPS